ncbi:serine/threonine-protein kinase Nek8 isoform X4 [Erythrolamprus reginae]|uniref:serine/threonine-protein kinase Nek8 isoform X4 n=1 Tax=Erythrolamprus reginae TaxID=121349 RepID=UPI00396D0506
MEKYERIRVVGRGAFGIVHLCLRRLDQKLVILKQIPVEQMSKDERLAAQNECQVLKLLHHPHIIEYYENFLEDKALMIAMEYAPDPAGPPPRPRQADPPPGPQDPEHPPGQAPHHGQDWRLRHLQDPQQQEQSLHRGGHPLLHLPRAVRREALQPEERHLGPGVRPLRTGQPEEGLRGSQPACFGSEDHEWHLRAHLGPLQPGAAPVDPQPSQPGAFQAAAAGGDPGRGPVRPAPAQPLHRRGQRPDEEAGEVVDGGDSRGPEQSRWGEHGGQNEGWSLGGPQAQPAPHLLLHLHLGLRHQRSPPPAQAQHGGGASLHGSHTEGRSDQVRAAGDVGAPALWHSRGSLAPRGHGAAAAPVCVPLPGRPVRSDHQAGGLRGSLHRLLDRPRDRPDLRQWQQWLLGTRSLRGRQPGRLGLGNQEPHNSPQQVPLPTGYEAQKVLCGIDASMILTSSHQILACGSNRYNKLCQDRLVVEGEPPLPTADQVEEVLTFSPANSAPLSQEVIVGADIGTAHSAAITASGQCYTIGSNQHGQLGPISCRASRAPYLVEGLQATRVTMVGCGDAFTLAVGAEGEVYTWGKSARGRLGRKEEESRSPRPVQLADGPPSLVVSVSCCHGTTLLTAKPLVAEEPSPQ